MGREQQSIVIKIPTGENESRSLKVSVDFTRDRSLLWSQVRVKLGPSQMAIKLGSDAQMELGFPAEAGPKGDSESPEE
jgi:hypothetical protein